MIRQRVIYRYIDVYCGAGRGGSNPHEVALGGFLVSFFHSCTVLQVRAP
jgi:hypothetical protein